MISNRRRTRLATTVLVMVVAIPMLMLAGGIPASASAHATNAPAVNNWAHHTIVVLPNGHDDTSDIQAAFNACVSYGPWCTVQLVPGTYHTAQITVYGFQGSFVGAGQGLTIVKALPNLPQPAAAYNTPTSPFWAGLPGPTNPWPDLFTFVNGTFWISGMTLNEPYANPVTAPGWYEVCASCNFTALWAVILVTGEQANAAISRVTVNGAGGDLTLPPGPTPSSYNLDTSIDYEGMLLPAGWSNPLTDQIPLSGTFLLTDSVIFWGQSAFWMENLLNATVVVNSNSIRASVLPGFADLSNSQLYVTGNSFKNIAEGAAVFGENSVYKTNLLPSTAYVTGNYMAVNWEGSGAGGFDFGPQEGIAATLNMVIAGNTIVSNNACKCYTAAVSDVIVDYAFASMVVSGNTLYGGGAGVEVSGISGLGVFVGDGPALVKDNTILGADYGVWLYGAVNTTVTGNLIKDSAHYGIALTNGSSYNLIEWNLVKHSGVYDLYWDGTGTGNVWFGNVCKTSSPLGLC